MGGIAGTVAGAEIGVRIVFNPGRDRPAPPCKQEMSSWNYAARLPELKGTIVYVKCGDAVGIGRYIRYHQ